MRTRQVGGELVGGAGRPGHHDALPPRAVIFRVAAATLFSRAAPEGKTPILFYASHAYAICYSAAAI